jgi:hypothetical protein
MPTATNEKYRTDGQSGRLGTAIERGHKVPRRPENLKLLCQPLKFHLRGLLNKLERHPQDALTSQIITDAAVYLLCTLDLLDRGAL